MKDLSPVLKAIKAKNPDAFIGITYPPDTILASTQAREIGFNPKFFTRRSALLSRCTSNAWGPTEGVIGMGSWNPKVSPGAKAYFDAHVSQMKKEPDRWASGHAWAGLEILQQAVEKVGLDRKALRDYIAGSEFDTILGRSASRAARIPASRVPSASGRAASSKWCGRQTAPPPSWQPLNPHGSDAGVDVNFSLFADLAVDGLVIGGIYAVVAIGLNMQYGLMRILNIAHGEFLMVGAYLTFTVAYWRPARARSVLPVVGGALFAARPQLAPPGTSACSRRRRPDHRPVWKSAACSSASA